MRLSGVAESGVTVPSYRERAMRRLELPWLVLSCLVLQTGDGRRRVAVAVAFVMRLYSALLCSVALGPLTSPAFAIVISTHST